ncbi:hypothetical protein Hanom_Chr03g00259681 [Helianthus anomalus]
MAVNSVMHYRRGKEEGEREGESVGWGPFQSQPITSFFFFLFKKFTTSPNV